MSRRTWIFIIQLLGITGVVVAFLVTVPSRKQATTYYGDGGLCGSWPSHTTFLKCVSEVETAKLYYVHQYFSKQVLAGPVDPEGDQLFVSYPVANKRGAPPVICEARAWVYRKHVSISTTQECASTQAPQTPVSPPVGPKT